MKECPKCGELVGNNVNVCFKCRYSFVYHCVLTSEEVHRDNSKDTYEEKRQAEIKAAEEKIIQLDNNPRYEYTTFLVNDAKDGALISGESRQP